MKVPIVDLRKNYKSHKSEIDQAIRSVINSASFILGPKVSSFEQNFAIFCQSKYCIGVDSGTSGLELALATLKIGKGDEVITPVYSFISSSTSVSTLGAKPVWVDVDPATFTLDPDKIEEKITFKTKAIMPVHLFGQPAKIDKILKIAKKHHLYVIEDACQAHGATFQGKKAGSFGDLAVFSFYPTKNLGAFGDAGAILTGKKKFAAKLNLLRNYGQNIKYFHAILGWNRRLDTIQAAILDVKLKYLEAENSRRRLTAQKYTKALSNLPISLPTVAKNSGHVFHQYVILTPKRDQLANFLKSQGIQTAIHYPLPIHLQAVYRQFNSRSYPVAEMLSKKSLALPIFPEISDKQIEFVTDRIKKFFK